MPIYEYKCHSCGEVSEVLVPNVNSARNHGCPACGSNDIEKIMSVPGLITGKNKPAGNTCCGRAERCETPPCSSGGGCHRH